MKILYENILLRNYFREKKSESKRNNRFSYFSIDNLRKMYTYSSNFPKKCHRSSISV